MRYDVPNRAARSANELIRLLAEAGVSIAGTRALRVRGRTTGKRRGVVINLLTVDGVDYVVSPRGKPSGRATRGQQAWSNWGALASSTNPPSRGRR